EEGESGGPGCGRPSGGVARRRRQAAARIHTGRLPPPEGRSCGPGGPLEGRRNRSRGSATGAVLFEAGLPVRVRLRRVGADNKRKEWSAYEVRGPLLPSASQRVRLAATRQRSAPLPRRG